MAVNLWENADVEAGVADWNAVNGCDYEQSSTKAWEQTYSLKFWSSQAYRQVISDVKPADASTQYTFSYYVNPDDGTVEIDTVVQDQDGGYLASVGVSTYTANEWTRVTKTFSTGVGDTGVKVRIGKEASTDPDPFYCDGFMLETGGSASAWVNYASGSAVDLTATIAAVTKVSGPMI